MNAQYKLNIHIKGYKSSNLPHQNTPTSQKIVDELARGHEKKRNLIYILTPGLLPNLLPKKI